MSNDAIRKAVSDVKAAFQAAGLKGDDLKAALRQIVAEEWPSKPKWSTLEHAVIEDVQKATMGSGVALVFEDKGIMKVVLARAGAHYKKPDQAEMPEAYLIPGGFINLTRTTGSSLVPPSNQPEDAFTGAAREVEEELKNVDGSPLLPTNPSDLKPMDTKTLAFRSGEKRIVVGMLKQLNDAEIAIVKQHIKNIAEDPAYAAAAAAQSINDDSGLPEVDGLAIFTLEDVAAGKVPLLHKDQQSLFQAVERHYETIANTPRRGHTHAYEQKVKTLDDLTETVNEWRAKNPNGTIGVTSGAYDILHPGHLSLLNDASSKCDLLITIIASDRTVRDQKGWERPFINEQSRAQSVAELHSTNLVIISDELYHETILKAIKPDVMFKGDDYKDKEIIGADLVGKVVLIPCAEKKFNSSSNFVKIIKRSKPES